MSKEPSQKLLFVATEDWPGGLYAPNGVIKFEFEIRIHLIVVNEPINLCRRITLACAEIWQSFKMNINFEKLMINDKCYLPQKSWFKRLTQGNPEGIST